MEWISCKACKLKLTCERRDGICERFEFDPRAQKFRIYSSEVMRRYEENGKYSPDELRVKEILEDLGFEENRDFFHNYRIRNDKGNSYFWLDFFIPSLHLNLEIDGRIWHSKYCGDPAKDRRRDKWLRRIGLIIIRIPSEKILKDELERIIREVRNEKINR